LVAAVSWAGLSWRVALLAVGAWGLFYARALASTRFPPPSGRSEEGRSNLVRELRANLAEVLRTREARRWLLFLFWLDLLEAPDVLAYVWLHEDVGMSQAGVAAYAAGEQVVGLLALLWLDRWLGRRDSRPMLTAVTLGLLVLYPMWLFAPGIWGRVVVGVPLAFLWALLWPIGRARSLTSVPGKAGAVTAVTTMFAVVPMSLLFGVLAETAGLRPAMLSVAVAALVFLLITARRS